MRTNHFKAIVKSTARVLAILSCATAAYGQQSINLTAAPTSTTMPDGTVVPMWGYFCGTAVTGSTATCAALNPASLGNPAAVPAVPATWSPVVITVPVAALGATSLTINLTNNLSFTPTGATTANTIPTSIVMVGQVGGGLGVSALRTTTQSPSHTNTQNCPSWFIAANPPGTPCTGATAGVSNTPPAQANRVQSFAAEVSAVAATTVATCTVPSSGPVTGCGTLTWTNLRPGTYLLESGTHPSIQVPMGLIGVLVVTTAPSGTTAGTAYPGAAATTTTAAIPAVQYNAELPLEFSEIDPVQNNAVNIAVNTAGFSATRVWSGLPVDPQGSPGCGNPASVGNPAATPPVPATYQTCYPPTVNYTPFYYLINGVAFNKTNASASVFPAAAGVTGTPPLPVITGITGTVLARLVNAGLRMHVPSIVGSLTRGFNGAGAATTVSGFTLIAEDGNPVPGVQVAGASTVPAAPRVQTDVFMAAGKVFDVLFNAPVAAVPPAAAAPALAIYDRELSLSGNSSVRDAGMVAYIGVNGAGLPVTAGTGVFSAAVARADTYNGLAPGKVFSVSDPSKGVIANDTNVYGVTLLAAPTAGTLTCNARPQNPTPGICANGTFTYTPNNLAATTVTPDQFTYCANNGFVAATTTTAASCSSTALTAMVTLGASGLTGNPSANAQSYTAQSSTYIKMPAPTLLLGNSDPSGLPLSVVVPTAPALSTGTGTLVQDAQGGFVVALTGTPTTATTATFSYTVQNSQGRTATGTVTVNFPAPSNLAVTVVDAQAYSNCQGDAACISGLPHINDYRWIIEEDKTFWIDPNCTTNNSATAPGCPAVVAAGGTVPTFGTNFHASHMDYVAQGCTGPLSCEGGQTMLDTRPGSLTLGTHIPAVCDLGNGACRPDPNCTVLPCTTSGGTTAVNPSSVHLDPTKRYYISILPGDAGNPFPAYTSAPNCLATPFNPDGTLNTACGHTLGGAQVQPACNIFANTATSATCTSASTAAFAPVMVKVVPTPLPTANLSVFVFEDDFPLNGEHDSGGGTGAGIVAPLEPGLGGFEIILWDTYGGLGDFTGQDTHDMFNQPLSNSLAGTVDPATGFDACPISVQVTSNVVANAITSGTLTSGTQGAKACTVAAPCTCTQANACTGDGTQAGITGRIVTCPKYESDNATLSPLAGQAVVANLMPDKFSIQAYPAADRIARGEEWLQTNTLDGQHPHDAFLRIGEPGYFQEFGPSGYHVAIGFANPKIINDRHTAVCSGSYGPVGPCTNTIQGQVDVQRLSRTPDQRLYPSGSRDALGWSQCWVSLGDPDAEDFMFAKCDANGNFKFTKVPGGNWRLTIGDQWNDQIIDGLSTPANVGCLPTPPATTCTGGLSTLNLGNIGVQQWQSNIYTRLFVDDNKNGIPDPGEIGVPQVYTRVKYRDGHNANTGLTDPNGVLNFNETFPLFNWYVVEPDLGRYKRTGTHVVYDAGGPADGSKYCGTTNGARRCGSSTAYNFLANTYEAVPLPADLSVPGAVYCANADCATEAGSAAAGATTTTAGTFQAGAAIASSSTASTGRIDPPWVNSEGWSGLTSQGNWIEFGVAPFAGCDSASPTTSSCANVGTTASPKYAGENGGIHGHTTYAATRPFDDASQMIEQPWSPNVPGVTINLYQEGFAPDGVTPTLTMVDTTVSTSWDAWAQGFYPGSAAGSGTGAGQKPYMSCPGQGLAPVTTGAQPPNADLFFFSLYDQPEYLDWYASLHGAGPLHTLPYNSQFKCYDSMHIWNQLQPAPYDGYYSFPSSLGVDATTGKPLTALGTTNGVASNMPGTNCTVCVANPTHAAPPIDDGYDPYRAGTPMLPPGKYVVEVVMPPGYEVYKEEDKNLLIGDNFIAPATVQFGGLGGSVFIMPDQASVASLYDPTGAGYNGTNYQNQTTALGTGEQLALPGFPGYQDPIWPCVGEMRVVPDYLSLFPQALETAPFAGASRPLCDRKEVTLADQMSVSVKFYIYTSTHIAGKFTGVITDDLTSEFDPFSPQFGEKFSPPNLPVATRDYLGNEVSRVYADHWGTFESMNFSTWDVNPPNITGYGPSMMVQCMNDKGPILDTRQTIPDPNNPANSIANPTLGQMITDPLYNPAYSQFCYTLPYMPGLESYLDTPVVPTQAYAGAGYNNADCAYPDSTPAISEVDGDGIGPWVSAAGHTLTITALGNTQVDNSGYSGPSARVAPFNLKKVQRHYGFGTGTGTVTIGGRAATVTGWTDTQIKVTVPTNVPLCPIQQQAQYGGSQARCGQLLITTPNTAAAGQPSNARQSIDTVTVTIGGKAPTHVAASQTIQSAIDAAAPGDLIIVDPTCNAAAGPAACSAAGITSKVPATHKEFVLMWKPVRLQGAGAASTILDANAHPAGKQLDPWRRHVDCLFGLALNGAPFTAGSSNAYDPSGTYQCPETGWKYFGTDLTGSGNGAAVADSPQIDRLPLEAVVGWDANLNGNIAELLQEPTLMGAYEGAGITVLAKGLEFHGQAPWNDGTEAGAFPAATTLLMGVGPNPNGLPVGDANPFCHSGTYGPTGVFTKTSDTNPYPSDFTCNPSSIDGLSVTDSSQGGGGIFLHGWAHHLQIANNRIFNNAGTLTGGISVGQGEFAGPYPLGGLMAAPGSCSDGTGFVTNQHLPDCFQVDVNVHNNMITNNSALGDELFSATLSGGGGATVCTGNDYYKFNYNWVCGNLSTGEGGGMVHLGEIQNGAIEHNSFLLNESSNPTIPTNGGGIMVQGTPDTDPVCPGVPDTDCPPGLSDGTGHNLVINANLIQANSADSGAGGGIRMNQVNGTDVATFATRPELWNNVSITNNIIVNNVAGWDGAGISLQDSLNVRILNNTIAHNDTLADSGPLTTSVGTPLASSPSGNCTMAGPTGASTASCPQPAGVSSALNSTLLTATFAGQIFECPDGMPNCLHISDPMLRNNVIWQNRSFRIGITGRGTGNLNQQNLVGLFSASGAAAPTQTATGQCSTTGNSYWEVGVRGDTGPSNHGSGFSLHPRWSVLTDATDYPSAFNLGSDPRPTSQYCNGSRVPPECTSANGCGGPTGFGVPPGIADAVTPNPLFSLTPAATVDEGNNWINVSWGPLALTNPACGPGSTATGCGTTQPANYGGGPLLANYALLAGSPAIDYIPRGQPHPATDFFGNPRPDPTTSRNCMDAGAVEFQGGVSGAGSGCSGTGPILAAIAPATGVRGTTFTVTLTGSNLGTPSSITAGGGITVTNIVPAPGDPTTVTATFAISSTAALTTRNVTYTGANGTGTLPGAFTVAPATVAAVSPTSALRGSTGLQIDIIGTGLGSATGVNLGGGITWVPGTLSVTADGTQLTVQVNISATAGLGARNVRVQLPGGTQTAVNAAVTFTVSGPTVTGITPATGTHNTAVPVTITGTGLTGTTAINVGGGITVSNITVAPGGGSLMAIFTIANTAARTTRNVTVVTPIGTTPVAAAATFTVN